MRPLTTVFERAHQQGLQIDRKLWEELVAAGFDLRVTRIGQRAYVLDGVTEQYLYRILEVKQQLPGRFRTGALAFELALRGDHRVPKSLVKREVTRRVRTLFGMIRRMLGRALGFKSRVGQVSRKNIKRASQKIARHFVRKIQNSFIRILAFTAWNFFIERFLAILYLYEDLRVNTRPLGELIYLWYRHRDPSYDRPPGQREERERAMELTGLLHDVRSVLTLNPKKNVLFQAVADADAGTIAELSRLAARPTKTVIAAMAIIAQRFPDALPANFWPSVEYHFPAIMVAMLVALRHTLETQKVIAELRESVDPAESIVPLVKDMVATFSGGRTDESPSSASGE